MRESGGVLSYTKVPLTSIIRRAYGVEAAQISGPTWLDSEAYDVTAKLPADTPLPRLQSMLQALLAERFKLAVHRQKKTFAAYALVVAKGGPKLRLSESGGLSYNPTRDNAGRHLNGKITMPILANNLSSWLGRPVSDRTGLKGLFDISLDFSTDDNAAAPALPTALPEQLGLKLKPGKAVLDVIVIDHAEKVPTEN
jgi:uncharacterized protein (TIGR03435 family)